MVEIIYGVDSNRFTLDYNVERTKGGGKKEIATKTNKNRRKKKQANYKTTDRNQKSIELQADILQ